MQLLLDELNEPQRQVVLATQGPVLVLAGAGSGKTRALTYRIAYLLEQGLAHPEEIMAVTFTNKAAREMRHRVAALLNNRRPTPPAIGTFHALGVRMLRSQHQYTNRSASFTILDTADTDRLVKQALEAQQVSTKEWNPKIIRQEISRAKNKLLTPPDLLNSASSPRDLIIARAYAAYEAKLRDCDSYDFDDLIVAVIRLLQEQAGVRAAYQQRWRYLSVDEYQDTNPAQEELLHLLLNPERNLCVVGDDYQAIYSWRGANVNHILQFEKRFPDCTTIYLTQNYRSTPTILAAANQVIAENHEQKHKELWTGKTTGQPVHVVALPSDRFEAAWIRQQLQIHYSQGNAAACVVLYRTNAQSRAFEEQFMVHQIPYTIVGGFRFYDRAEVKDAMALLHWWVNPRANLALARLTQTLLPGIGPKTLQRFAAEAQQADCAVAEWLRRPGVLTARQHQIVAPLLRAYDSAHQQTFARVADLLQHLVTASGYKAYLQRQPDGEERWENVEELFTVAATATDAATFVEEVALLSDLDEQSEQTNRVTCMTLHAAKGLEFDHVFIAGCEEGLLPHSNSLDLPSTLEEERRLLYVGMTRAKQTLTLTYATLRTLHGETSPQLASRFLTAIPATVERLDAAMDMPMTSAWQDLGLAGTGGSDQAVTVAFEAGHYVTHPHFGRGIVIQVSGNLLTCVFPTYGVKTIDGAVINNFQ